jgi:hypothetical protein
MTTFGTLFFAGAFAPAPLAFAAAPGATAPGAAPATEASVPADATDARTTTMERTCFTNATSVAARPEEALLSLEG